jgi:hypothetical protein
MLQSAGLMASVLKRDEFSILISPVPNSFMFYQSRMLFVFSIPIPGISNNPLLMTTS